MMEKKAPKATPLAASNGKAPATSGYVKCIKALKALSKTIVENQ
jgi:hypothetical protein